MNSFFKNILGLSLIFLLSGCNSVYISSSFKLSSTVATAELVSDTRAIIRRLSSELGGACPLVDPAQKSQYKCIFENNTSLLELTAYQSKSILGYFILIRSVSSTWYPDDRKTVRRHLSKEHLALEQLVLEALTDVRVLSAKRSYAGYNVFEEITKLNQDPME